MKGVKLMEKYVFDWEKEHILPDLRRMWPGEIKSIVVPAISSPPFLDGSLDSPVWGNAVCVEPNIPVMYNGPIVKTKVFLCYDRNYLYIGVRAENPIINPSVKVDQKAHHRRMENEQVCISIDAFHDHRRYVSVFVDALGQCYCRSAQGRVGFTDWDYYFGDPSYNVVQDKKICLRSSSRLTDDGWQAEAAIPFSDLEVRTPVPGTVMGLNVSRLTSELPTENYQYEFSWMDRNFRCGEVLAMTMGDMAFARASISLVSINFPNVTWGTNYADIKLMNNTNSDVSVYVISRGLCGVWAPYEYSHAPITSEIVQLPANGTVQATFRYEMPVFFMPSNIAFEIRDSISGECLYEAIYDLGTCPLVYPFGVEKHIEPPLPGTPYFIEKRMRYIVSRQPLLRRRTTRQGAESDFVIDAIDGSVKFNLMKDGVMSEIGSWLCSLYNNDEDRVIGAAFFLAQQAVMVYSASRTYFASQSNALTILRSGGGFCGNFAQAYVGLISHLKSVRTGKFFKARVLEVSQHALNVVWMDDHWAVIDPTSMNIKAFFRRDHRSLATAEELRDDPNLVWENGSTLTKFLNADLRQLNVQLANWPQGAPHQ